MKRTTSGLPFAIALAVLLLFAAGAVRAQADSNDGKVLTITTKGMDASGKPFNNVAVYDKQ
jgi:hypothetical protein